MIFLIDYENVNLNGLAGIEQLKEEDRVFIFLGHNVGAISFEWHIKISSTPARVRYFKCGKVSKNYLDFQLSTYCGYLIAGMEKGGVFLVSKDKGYDSVVDFWKDNKEDLEVRRVSSIIEGLGQPAPVETEVPQPSNGRRRPYQRRGGKLKPNHGAKFTNEIREENLATEVLDMPVEEQKTETADTEMKAASLPETEESVVKEGEASPSKEPEVPARKKTRRPKSAPKKLVEKPEEEPVAEEEKPEEEPAVEEEKKEEAKPAKKPRKKKESVEKVIPEEKPAADILLQPENPREEDEETSKKRGVLAESIKKRIRTKIKDEELKGGSYTTIYNIFLKERAKNRFNTALVKAFQQEKGNRIYKKLLPEFEDHMKKTEEFS